MFLPSPRRTEVLAAALALLAALAMLTACGSGVTPRPSPPSAAGPSFSVASPAPAPPPTPAAPSVPPPWAPVAPPDVAMGIAAPTLVQAVAPDGRWAVLCQARVDTNGDGRLDVAIGPHGDPYGDTLAPYFVEGQGPGVPIDDFLGADPTGRFVLLLRGQPVLRDTVTGRDTALDGERSPIAFGAGGEELVYVRRQGGGPTVVVHTLASGAETVLHPGPGELLGMQLYPRARALRVVMKLPDPGGARDVSHTNLYRGRCAGRAASSYHWAITHSVREQRLVSSSDARVLVVPEEIRPFLHWWLRKLEDGSLRFETFLGAGSATPASPPAPAGNPGEIVKGPTCGKVLFSDPVRGRLIASCPEGPAFGLRLFGEGAPRLLGTFDREVDQSPAPFGRHLLITTRDLGDLIFDVESGERRQVPTFQRMIAIRGNRTLVQRGEELVLLDGGGERVLGPIEPYPRVFGVHDAMMGEAERVVLVGTLAVDLARGETVGVVPDEPAMVVGGRAWPALRHQPFAFTKDGWVLVQSAPPRGARAVSDIGLGPMRWAKLAPLPGK